MVKFEKLKNIIHQMVEDGLNNSKPKIWNIYYVYAYVKLVREPLVNNKGYPHLCTQIISFL